MIKKPKTADYVELLYKALAELKTPEEVQQFLSDLCTEGEVIDLGKRIKAATMLRSGATYTAIADRLGLSSITISRVNRSIKQSTGGYNIVFDRLDI